MRCPVQNRFLSSLKSTYWRVLSGDKVYLVFVGIFSLLMLIGIAAGIHALFIAGSRQAYGTYREIPLALLISTYIFFVVASTGLCLVSSIGHVFGFEKLMPLARRSVYLSIVTIAAGFLVIGLEIEHPFRMVIYNIVSPNFSSNIWWMGTLYGFALVFLTAEFVYLIKGNHKNAAAAGLLGVITEVAANSNLGGVFGMLHGREYWYGPYFSIYFVVSAMATGCAFIIFFTFLSFKIKSAEMDDPTRASLKIVSKLAILLLAIIALLTFWKTVTMSAGEIYRIEALKALISGPYAFNFWGLEITGGIVIPFVLLLLSGGKRVGLMFAASAVMIVCIFFLRLDMVVVGQIVPLYLELGVNEYSRLHAYWPSVHEILVALGGAGFCGLAFLLGEKIFDGFTDTITDEIPEENIEEQNIAGEAL